MSIQLPSQLAHTVALATGVAGNKSGSNAGSNRDGQSPWGNSCYPRANQRLCAQRWPGPALGSVVGQNGSVYLLESELGAGGLGIVYRARRLSDGQVVALKLASSHKDPVGEELLRREAQILSLVSHPNIVKVIDFGDTLQGEPYLAMELIEGQTLNQLIREQGALPLDRAINLCLQLADAMEHFHQAGIVHRDLKPANIMVSTNDGKDHVFVLDFGISTSGSTEEEKGAHGSFLYMSPEQMRHDFLTSSSDIYQFGLILFQCLTGKLPFEATIQAAVDYRLGGEETIPFDSDGHSTVPWPELESILRGALNPDAECRVQTMALIGQQLRRLASAEQYDSPAQPQS